MVAPGKKQLLYMSWLTLLGMSAIGILLILYWQEREVGAVLLGSEPYYRHVGHKPYYLQTIAGLFFGSLAALLAVILINGRQFKSVRTFFAELMGEMNPSFVNIIFFSLCAAVGEEILFRAGLQPKIGIWPSAILFVILHGYINPANLNLTIYGLVLIIICAGFGYLFMFFGLASAVIAHFVYDVAMFSVLKYSHRKHAAVHTR
jgi:uncharacterized protein